ncbi:hypothetical protein GCM10011391_34770 [Pullulanibacillus camelliae]|uniref:Energy coupling factor transporter S component ThiW n=1 Tax=Pullulanibacillus camelliae TaxID=1707096 RepID=A0A8J2YLQ9_9BACL|nr:energy coupling factor transporter S component ThiW [Pullulanibacillus camelliae]GGE52927.1 hypothetical protein GCM10011391_34770 [Pullulanibacillus camelliae]
MTTRKLVFTALFVALGVVTGDIIFIPIGVSKIFPVQHVINVLTAVLLGPWYSVICAFTISIIRNGLGTGSLLAFPGSMIGAFLAGYLFRKTRIIGLAVIGEIIGTGFIGALASYPIAKLLYGMDVAAFYFVTPFSLATIAGSILAYIILKSLQHYRPFMKWMGKDGMNK